MSQNQKPLEQVETFLNSHFKNIMTEQILGDLNNDGFSRHWIDVSVETEDGIKASQQFKFTSKHGSELSIVMQSPVKSNQKSYSLDEDAKPDDRFLNQLKGRLNSKILAKQAKAQATIAPK